MKRVFECTILAILVALLGVCVWTSVSTEKELSIQGKYAYTGLFSDNGYVDYAKDVNFDLEKDPDLRKMGLYWVKWDAINEVPIWVDADSQEGANLIDTSKPTFIMIHGMQGSFGINGIVTFDLNTKSASSSEFGLDTEKTNMFHLWMEAGWNVGIFHYEKLCTNEYPTPIEEKIWSTDKGVYYQKDNGQWTTESLPYCVAEYFVGEYLRAMNLLPDTMGDQEIRVAAHSMGGQVSAPGLFLLSQMVDDGQLKAKQFPDRYTMLDTYFSAAMQIGNSTISMGAKDINVHWSGKPIYENDTGLAMVECIKIMEEGYGLTCEYYANEMSTLKMSMTRLTQELRKLTTYTILHPEWSGYGNGYNELNMGHNGNMEWYLCSIIDNEILTADGSKVPCANLKTEDLKALQGRQFRIIEGDTTVTTIDDVMEEVFYIEYYLDGGKNGYNYIEYYPLEVGNSILTLDTPKKEGFVFVGYYNNKDFTGEIITKVKNNENKALHLYAKWEAK
ncbi:MAG: InlB B-repeat-containing protein [Clostridia bacterium]